MTKCNHYWRFREVFEEENNEGKKTGRSAERWDCLLCGTIREDYWRTGMSELTSSDGTIVEVETKTLRERKYT